MKIIGCDFHPSFQQIAMVDTETGEQEERRLTPSEAVQFYRQLQSQQVLVGMEASGNSLWFERLLAELGHQMRLGDASKIRAMEVRKQKTDRRDAELLLKLLLENRFPEVWVPSLEMRDVRQLLLHRHKAGGDAAASEEPTATSGFKPGRAEEVETVEPSWPATVAGVTAERVDGTTEKRSAGVAGRAGPGDRGVGSGGGAGGQKRCCGPTAADPSWNRAGHQPGFCADAGEDREVSAQPAGGQLSGTESGGELQRRTTAAGRDQQARQSDVAQFVGGSGTERVPWR